MPYPKQSEIELPLLKTIAELGGEAKPKTIYPIVAKRFPDLTEEDLNQRMESSPSTHKWWNLVQWTRQSLVMRGEIESSKHGVWKITANGIKRLKNENSNKNTAKIEINHQSNLRDLYIDNVESVKKRIVSELNELSPHAFEKFCKSLLEQMGYENIVVTKQSADGGIDGYGKYRQGVVVLDSAFQAKKWKQNPISSVEIDKFRGAIQGSFDHGLFLTTNRFSKPAQEISVKKGAIPILLLDGDTIAVEMIRSGLGVKKEPLYLLDIDKEFFDFDED